MKVQISFNVDEEVMECFVEEYRRIYGIPLENPEMAFEKGFQRYVKATINNYIEDGEAIDYIVKNAYNYMRGM